MYFRAGLHISIARPLAHRYSLGFSIGIGCWIASLFVFPPLRFILWALGIVIDYSTTLTVRQHQAKLALDISHLPERFGLFTIIVLGESVLAVISGVSAKEQWDISVVITAMLGFFLAFSLWWIYFSSVEGSAIRRTRYAGQIWVYAHLPLVMCLAAAGAGMKLIISHKAENLLPDAGLWLFAGAIAFSFVSIGIINLTTVSKVFGRYGKVVVSSHFVGAAIVLGLAAVGTILPPVVFVGIVTVLGAVQVIIILAYKARSQAESELADV
jgi:low temperature requirement protein LtrA